MKKLGVFLVSLFALCLFALPAMAGSTDTAAISITVNNTFYVALTAGADWTDTVVEADFLAGYIASDSLTDVLDIAGNAAYEITAQMSAATWDVGNVVLKVNVDSAGETSLVHTAATVITGLDNEAAGSQSDLDIVWKLDGITWANTQDADDWTNTVTFTCQANT